MKAFFDCVSIEAISSTVPPRLQDLNEEFLDISAEDIQRRVLVFQRLLLHQNK